MRRGTTPTITINVESIDLTQLKSLYVTFSQAGVFSITKKQDSDGVTVEAHKVSVKLTQKETLKFRAGGQVYYAIRGLYESGDAIASEPKPLPGTVGSILLDGVIE